MSKAITCSPFSDDKLPKWKWAVEFGKLSYALDYEYIREIGAWLHENIPAGCNMLMPNTYLFTCEEDALLTYMRFR